MGDERRGAASSRTANKPGGARDMEKNRYAMLVRRLFCHGVLLYCGATLWMTRYGCITFFLLRPRTKSSPQRLQARPESVRLIEDRHFASRHLIQHDGDGETCTRGSLVD